MPRPTSLAAVLLVAALAGALLPLAARVPPARAAAAFVVNGTVDLADADPGDGRCDALPAQIGDQCTLRAAIEQANATAGADTVAFNIPGGGVRTIAPASRLPPIADALTIDGYSQRPCTTNAAPCSRPNTATDGSTNAVLLVELDGTNAGVANGLTITADDSLVKGLVINRFLNHGVRLGDHNGATGNRLEGCFLGTDPTGTLARGNFSGVVVDGPVNLVGGTRPAARNLISGNRIGVNIAVTATGTTVQGNSIGTDKSGADALANDGGVLVSSPNTLVGGTTPGARNLISGNGDIGVSLSGSATGTRVQGNLIGTDKTGAAPLGNGNGIVVSRPNNLIGGNDAAAANTIAFNANDGVGVAGGIATRILRNAIFANGGLGIDLRGGTENAAGATANDPKDPDTGPNTLQNRPRLDAATTTGGTTSVRGLLNSTPGQRFVLRFFANPAGQNEGQTFAGQKVVTTDANGNASFTFAPASPVAVNRALTATATNVDGDTSEFSAARTVTAG